MVWARDSVRGSASRLMAVTPAVASAWLVCGSMSGWSSPMTAWPLRSLAISAADGFWTRSTTSAELYMSEVVTTVAPAAT